MNPQVPDWLSVWWPVYAPFVLALVAGSVTGTWAVINRRGGERAKLRDPLPPTWPEMWARLDAQETEIEEAKEREERMYRLFKTVIHRTGVTLTESELEELEQVRPSYKANHRVQTLPIPVQLTDEVE